jgi:N-acetylglutamate synthase-like GNAT family acetyltransferase
VVVAQPEVRVTDGREKARVDAFYASQARTTRIDPSDRLVVAECEGVIVGVVRLREEEGHLVLRTMRIAESFRSRGLGTRMLRTFEPLVTGRDCYCLPYDHLTAFYGQIGFRTLLEELAPPHLRARLRQNLANGERMLVMQRASAFSVEAGLP